MQFAKKHTATKQFLKLTVRRRLHANRQRAQFIAALQAPVSAEAKEQELKLVERARAAKDAPFLDRYRVTA